MGSIGTSVDITEPEPEPSYLIVVETTGAGAEIPKNAFQRQELITALSPTLRHLLGHNSEAFPFQNPLDPMAIGIPEYAPLIKHPMDFSTIRRKLEGGIYADPWQYISDVWLIFSNAWLVNHPRSRVFEAAKRLSKCFQLDIDPVMQSLGLCCGQRYAYKPPFLNCSGDPLCVIQRDEIYHNYRNRFMFCHPCFTDINGSIVRICDADDSARQQVLLSKDEFFVQTVDYLQTEPFVPCIDCGRRFHQICVLHLDLTSPEGYTCDNCLNKWNFHREENLFTAELLITTELSSFIQNRVRNFLKKHLIYSTELQVFIRVVSAADKVIEAKPKMRKLFVNFGIFPEKFPYRAKTILAFQSIDGVDVLFFGMHVQEYGSECPSPNTRRVFISYLDSVHFFQPRNLKTEVYQEILLGYLQYVKGLGFTMAHIWSCPPAERDDCMFNCHPTSQKLPGHRRLHDWFRKMLNKGMGERIIADYKDIYKQAIYDRISTIAALPYFEGDFWPVAFEGAIASMDPRMIDAEMPQMISELRKGRPFKLPVDIAEAAWANAINNTRHSPIHPRLTKPDQDMDWDYCHFAQATISNRVFKMILATMSIYRDAFFVVRLHTTESIVQQAGVRLGAICDPDPLQSSELMEERAAFVRLCCDERYEFSSLRRAKYSTMAILYDLHVARKDRFIYTCNKCRNLIVARHHCTVCEDFDLCHPCFQQVGHVHAMNKLGTDERAGQAKATAPVPAEAPAVLMNTLRDPAELFLIQLLVTLTHANDCRGDEALYCTVNQCMELKRAVSHAIGCKFQIGDCLSCVQILSLCWHHTRDCRKKVCVIPFCTDRKKQFARWQAAQLERQNKFHMRRVETMRQLVNVRPTFTPLKRVWK